EFEFLLDFLEGFGRKTAFAIGEELFADVGAFGPSPELFFLFSGGIGLLEGEPGPVEFDPFSEKVAAAQARDIGTDFAEPSPAGGLIDRGPNQSTSRQGILEGEPESHAASGGAGGSLRVRVGLIIEVGEEIGRGRAVMP